MGVNLCTLTNDWNHLSNSVAFCPLRCLQMPSHGSTAKNSHEGDGIVQSYGNFPNHRTLPADIAGRHRESIQCISLDPDHQRVCGGGRAFTSLILK